MSPAMNREQHVAFAERWAVPVFIRPAISQRGGPRAGAHAEISGERAQHARRQTQTAQRGVAERDIQMRPGGITRWTPERHATVPTTEQPPRCLDPGRRAIEREP